MLSNNNISDNQNLLGPIQLELFKDVIMTLTGRIKLYKIFFGKIG